jgi:hypothetical protein
MYPGGRGIRKRRGPYFFSTFLDFVTPMVYDDSYSFSRFGLLAEKATRCSLDQKHG